MKKRNQSKYLHKTIWCKVGSITCLSHKEKFSPIWCRCRTMNIHNIPYLVLNVAIKSIWWYQIFVHRLKMSNLISLWSCSFRCTKPLTINEKKKKRTSNETFWLYIPSSSSPPPPPPKETLFVWLFNFQSSLLEEDDWV
jgi:hypothetical protein